MSDQPRRRFQFSLMTAVYLAFIAAVAVLGAVAYYESTHIPPYPKVPPRAPGPTPLLGLTVFNESGRMVYVHLTSEPPSRYNTDGKPFALDPNYRTSFTVRLDPHQKQVEFCYSFDRNGDDERRADLKILFAQYFTSKGLDANGAHASANCRISVAGNFERYGADNGK